MDKSVSASRVAEWTKVDAPSFQSDVVARYQPALFRGLVGQWPAVELAKKSMMEICNFLTAMDTGHPVDALMLAPAERGRIFYNATMDRFNFLKNKLPLAQVIEQIARYSHFENPPAVAVQSALVESCMPKFLAGHKLPLLDESVQPRVWIGNAITTPAHFDESSNIACVVAGSRRFTLFPPEQIGNLYLGPLDFAPTGTPISLVDFRQPDFNRFPRFRDALKTALIADLGPGDAIYIPPLWWHHVESFDPFNMLVNYWWRESADTTLPSGIGCLWHAIASLRQLPDAQRDAWRQLFEHYIFGPNGNAEQHLPPALLGILGRQSEQQLQELRERIKVFADKT